jgi:hypothetical protein
VKKLLFILPALCLFIIAPLYAQETLDDTEQSDLETLFLDYEMDELPPPDNDSLFVIAGFEYDIKGRTRPGALAYRAEFKVGEKLEGMAGLEEYINDKTQVLINQRVLEDNPEITYSIGKQQEDGTYPVIFTIKVEDTWNIIALPYPKYSSNSGLDLTIKARDYNFFGTMYPLRVDLGYSRTLEGRNSFSLGFDFNIPFKALGYNWNFTFDNTFGYRPGVSEPFYYKNTTGISMELPFRRTTFIFGFNESVNVNEENPDAYKILYSDYHKGLYMSSMLYTLWLIPTGLQVSNYGELTYSPAIFATFNHGFPKWPLEDFRKGPFLVLSHSLGFEKIDWHGNYREGLSASLSNSFAFDIFNRNNYPLTTTLSLTATGHFIIRDFFGISSRLMYRHWFHNAPGYNGVEASDVLRGVSDSAISANYMLSLNLDFPLRVLSFKPSQWLDNNKLRFFDFEVHLSPVIDMAIYNEPLGTSFNPKNTLVTGGLEAIVFSDFMRSLYLRVCFAFNLREMIGSGKIPGGQNREITLMMGLFY